MVKRLLSNEPSPETVREVPFGSEVAFGGITKTPNPETDKTNGIPSAIISFTIKPFATTGIVSVLLSISSPAALKYVAVPM